MAKIDFQLDYKKFAYGTSIRYTSFMDNVDDVFTRPIVGTIEILPGYGPYRDARRTGDIICDARVSYGVTKTSRLSLLMNNVFNREYSNRPGNVMPPRTVICQYTLRF
jgi:outer membrane receptor protein involved in Fe transport